MGNLLYKPFETPVGSTDSFMNSLTRKLRFEVDDIESLGEGTRFGKSVKIGKAEWCLGVQADCANQTGNIKYLGVHLTCLSKILKDDFIIVELSFQILNQSNPRNEYKTVKTHNVFSSFRSSKGVTNFMKWPTLMTGGYVRNGKIIVDCEVNIITEKIFNSMVNFGEPRPNNEDVKIMLSSNQYQTKKQVIKKEIELSQITENFTVSDTTYIDGIPCKISLRKQQIDSQSWLTVGLCCLSSNKSDWWRVEATAEFRLKNKINKFISRSIYPGVFRENENSKGSEIIKWNELVDLNNGYVNNERIIIETMVYIRDKYGFDESSLKGIDKPMTKMTDAVITVDGVRFHICRMILSHHSSWFCDLFSRDPNKTVFFSDVDKNLFLCFLKLAYYGCIMDKEDHDMSKLDEFMRKLDLEYFILFQNPMSISDAKIYEENLEKFLELLDHYKADECIRRCDHLMLEMKISDDLKILKLIDKYSLPKMKKYFCDKLKASDNLQNVFAYPEFMDLSEQLRKDLMMEDVPETMDDDPNETHYTYSKIIYKSPANLGLEDEFQKLVIGNDDHEFWSLGCELQEYFIKKYDITFKEFSDKRDMVLFKLQNKKIFFSSKQILANVSRYFMKEFYGPDAKSEQMIKFDDVTPDAFGLFLTHIYHPTKSITVNNIDALLTLARRFSVLSLFEKCENYLQTTDDVPKSSKMKYAKTYNLKYK